MPKSSPADSVTLQSAGIASRFCSKIVALLGLARVHHFRTTRLTWQRRRQDLGGWHQNDKSKPIVQTRPRAPVPERSPARRDRAATPIDTDYREGMTTIVRRQMRSPRQSQPNWKDQWLRPPRGILRKPDKGWLTSATFGSSCFWRRWTAPSPGKRRLWQGLSATRGQPGLGSGAG